MKQQIASATRRFIPLVAVGLFVGTCMMSGGCTTTMEDGYTPKSLSASPTQRRGYYASPFSPEAEAAAKDKGANSGVGRPSLGGGY